MANIDNLVDLCLKLVYRTIKPEDCGDWLFRPKKWLKGNCPFYIFSVPEFHVKEIKSMIDRLKKKPQKYADNG